MKLGSKKTKQAELIDALGGDVLASPSLSTDVSTPPTPSVSSPAAPAFSERGSVPEIVAERQVLSHLR